jgi:hypothetical protein
LSNLRAEALTGLCKLGPLVRQLTSLSIKFRGYPSVQEWVEPFWEIITALAEHNSELSELTLDFGIEAYSGRDPIFIHVPNSDMLALFCRMPLHKLSVLGGHFEYVDWDVFATSMHQVQELCLPQQGFNFRDLPSIAARMPYLHHLAVFGIDFEGLEFEHLIQGTPIHLPPDGYKLDFPHAREIVG